MKDKRILKELFDNGRMPFSVVAKKVGLSKEVVSYRVNNMIKDGLLIGFNSVYDVKKIGFQTYLVYVKLKNIDNRKEEEIVAELSTHPNIAWIVKCIGNFDLILKFFVKDNMQLSAILKELEKKFDYFSEFETDNVSVEIPVPAAYLYSPLRPKELPARDEDKLELNKIEIGILENLAKDSRMQISEISKKLKIQRDTIKYHLKKLEKEKVILTYRPSAWSGSKSLGYSWYFVSLKFRQLDKQKKSKLSAYLVSNMNVTYIYELSGYSDLGFEIRLRTGDELSDVLMHIRGLLAGDFKSQELSLILKEHKYTYFTGCMKV
jgi:Lrp/AsnC family transcriptional regulator for asnA, asnC and gidA